MALQGGAGTGVGPAFLHGRWTGQVVPAWRYFVNVASPP